MNGQSTQLAWETENSLSIRYVIIKSERQRQLKRQRQIWQDLTEPDLKETGCEDWIGFIWLTIGTGDMILLTWLQNFSFHGRRENS